MCLTHSLTLSLTLSLSLISNISLVADFESKFPRDLYSASNLDSFLRITEDEELEDLGSRKRIEIKAAINAAEILSATLDSSSMEVIEEDEEES